MSEDELRKIGEFLEMHAFAHRTVEHCDYWTYEEKMILDLYNNYLNLLDQQKEFIEWLESEIERIPTLTTFFYNREGHYISETEVMLKEAKKVYKKYKEIIGVKDEI